MFTIPPGTPPSVIPWVARALRRLFPSPAAAHIADHADLTAVGVEGG